MKQTPLISNPFVGASAHDPRPETEPFGFAQVLAAYRRQKWVIATVIAIALALAIAYLVVTPPNHTATAKIIIEMTAPSAVDEGQIRQRVSPEDQIVDAQIEVLTSDTSMLGVVDALDLQNDPEFVGQTTLLTSLFGLIRSGHTPEELSAEEKREVALEAVRERIGVERVNGTPVLQIQFTSQDPEKSALITNEFVDQYINQSAELTSTEALDASKWLKARADEILVDIENINEQIQALRAEMTAGGSTGGIQAQISVLVQEAETYSGLRQEFLKSYSQSLGRPAFPVSSARVLTPARAPNEPSSPNKTAVVALSLVLALIVGAGLSILYEMRDQTFRRGADVERILGVKYIGLVPHLRRRFFKRRKKTEVLEASRGTSSETFDETLRRIKVDVESALGAKRPRVIGFVSALPSEGKTLVAAHFATMLADSGEMVRYLDSDLRRETPPDGLFTLHRRDGLKLLRLNEVPEEAVHLHSGQLDLLTEEERERLLTVIGAQDETEEGQKAAPKKAKLGAPNAGGRRRMLSNIARSFEAAMALAGGSPSYVIVDLAAIGLTADASALADHVDAFVLVTRWGSTRTSTVQSALARNPQVAKKCIGVVLNDVAMSKMHLYDANETTDSYQHSLGMA